jgi:asparagine synthase (glutamine-hydrolysing)
MTTRIFGISGRAPDLDGIPRKTHESFLSIQNTHFWGTSHFPIKRFEDHNIIVIADWNIYGSEVSGVEDFVEIYKKSGIEEVLRSIRGEFSVALYDKRQEFLYIARDRFGYKPLYYAHVGDLFAFSSHASWLLKIPKINTSLNEKALALFAGGHYRYIDNSPDTSFFNGVSQLPATSYLAYKNGKIKVYKYWNMDAHINYQNNENQIIEKYRDLFIRAVDQREKAIKGKKCFLLSGGLDSSSVLAASVSSTGEKQQAFSTVYEDKEYDESDDIKTILGDCVSCWHPIPTDEPDFFSIIKKMVRDNDGPVATATWLSHYLLYDKISRLGFTDIFGGLGGDEVNAGEFEHFFYFFADLKVKGLDDRLLQEINHWAQHHGHPLYRKNFEVATRSWELLTDQNNPGKIFFDNEKYSRYYHAINKDFFNLEDFYPFLPHYSESYLNNKTLSDIFYETIPCCFRANDRHDFAFNLRTHFPFFDHELMEFAHQIPAELKTVNGVTKNILRKAMKGILPEQTRTRIKKTGWNAPFHVWMFQKQNKENLYDLIHSRPFAERGIYNPKVVHHLLKEHEEIVTTNKVSENHMMFFWQLVNLELWFQSLD